MKNRLLAVCIVMVTCACGGGGGVRVGPNPPGGGNPITVTISPATLTRIDQGQSVKFTVSVANDSNAKGVTWSASGSGLTGTAAGSFSSVTASGATYNAPAPVSANTTITVTATSVADTTKSSSASVVVSPLPSIAATALVPATPNANYSATLQASGGAGTLTWSVAGGALPTGLSLSSTGTITGDPTASGTWTFTVQVTDSSAATGGADSAQARFSLTVVTPVTIGTASLPAGAEGVAYLAEVTAAGGTPPYTWSVTSGSLPSGLTLQPQSGVISGSPGSPGNFSFTVAARDSSPMPQSQTQPLAIAIGAPGPLIITTSSLLDGTVGAPYYAKVAVTGGAPPYTWSVAGSLPGSLSFDSSTGAISGTPSSTGTASFSVTVQDSSAPPQTQTQSLSISVVGAPAACEISGNNTALSGSYAFSLSGFNSAGFLAVVGSFTADGSGNITAGEADSNGVLGVQHGDLLVSNSNYSVGPDGRGCATLATPFGIFSTRFVLGAVTSNPATAGRMIAWNSPSVSALVATGQLLRQSSNLQATGIAGSYAYRTAGWDAAPLGGRDVCLGVLTASANTLTALEQDCNDAATITTTAAPDVAGAYTALDAHGRGTAIIALGETNASVTYYAVSGSRLLALTADPFPALMGEWDQQIVPAGASGFAASSLSGNLVFHLDGLSLGGTATDVSVETATADGSSTITLNFYEDRAGTMQVASAYTCNYVVEPTGRVTLNSSSQTCGGTPPVLYLIGLNTGFIVDAAPGVDSGSFEPQSAGPFNIGSLSGSFAGGMEEVAIQTSTTEVDSVTPNGNGSFGSATADISSISSQEAGAPFPAGTYNVNSDGTFTFDSSAGAVAGIIISPTKFLMFSPSTLATSLPTLLVMQK